jgi:hypothetical protein
VGIELDVAAARLPPSTFPGNAWRMSVKLRILQRPIRSRTSTSTNPSGLSPGPCVRICRSLNRLDPSRCPRFDQPVCSAEMPSTREGVFNARVIVFDALRRRLRRQLLRARRHCHERVLMVQASQYLLRAHKPTRPQMLPGSGGRSRGRGRLGGSGTPGPNALCGRPRLYKPAIKHP